MNESLTLSEINTNEASPAGEEPLKAIDEESTSELPRHTAVFSELEAAEAEYSEFISLFPKMKLCELPDQVINDITAGVPLVAACALYERRREALRSVAAAVNEKNREAAFAIAGNGTQHGEFTPEQVKSMSNAEIKTHYKSIIESMKHWNRKIFKN